MSTSVPNTTPVNSTPGNTKRKLPFGHFKVGEHVIKPTNQIEMSKGWQLKIPKFNNSKTIHHWSVSLAQLPPHLWHKIDLDKLDYKNTVRDGIYFYSINTTKNDETFKSIYNELMKEYKSDKKYLQELVSLLDEDVVGWLIIRAKEYINNRYIDIE